MLIIILAIVAASGIHTLAKKRGRNAAVWAAGSVVVFAGSFYAFGFVVFPALVAGKVTQENLVSYQIMGTVIAYAIAFGLMAVMAVILVTCFDKVDPQERYKKRVQRARGAPAAQDVVVEKKDPNPYTPPG